jgi:hypothetical protein
LLQRVKGLTHQNSGRRKMKKQWVNGWRLVPMLFAGSILAWGQTAQQTDRMPAPGTLNYVEGRVSVNGADVSSSSVRSTVLQPGNTIQTGQGYAEVLLVPGAFLRLGHNTQARFLTAGLADTQVEIDHGSAMVEAADLVKGTKLGMVMDGATAQLEKKGLYAFDASGQSVQVFDGEAKVSEGDRVATLKKGNEVMLGSAQPLKKQDFNSKAEQTTPLYVWSKVRSENEAEANYSIANRFAIYGDAFAPGWYWDPYWNFYSFVPAWGAFYSPFGFPFYSPAFAYGYGPYLGVGVVRGYYGHHFGRGAAGFHAVGGMRGAAGFHGGGFHGGGFHGGHR